MALLNWMVKGSYTVVDDVTYSKERRQLRLTLTTYSDSSKAAIISQNAYQLDGKRTTPRLVGRNVTALPVAPATANDVYLIAPAASFPAPAPGAAPNPLSGVAGTAAVWSGPLPGGNWSFVFSPAQLGVVFDVTAGKNFPQGGTSAVEAAGHFDTTSFDNFFDIAKIGGAAGKDILAACYTYLASRPEFAGTSAG